MVYGAGSILLRTINFLLIPLYTRYLTPADYGIMAVTTTIMAVLQIIYPLSLHSAAMRFYFLANDEDEQRRNSGTIWLAMLVSSLTMTLMLDLLGRVIAPSLFRDIPFDPYLRLAIWISFFSTLGLLPLALFQAKERPIPYVLTTISSTLLSIGLVINLVVFQRRGVHGYLLGLLWSQILFAVPYIVLTLRNVKLSIHLSALKAALDFSLPLVPHGLAGWTLQLSDRVVLQRFVPLGEVGLYSLGYQFGNIINLLATAINFAWAPFLYKTHAQHGESANPKLSRLVTYYTLCLCFVALGLALFVKEIIFFMAAPAFHSAYRVVPWVIGGLLFNGLYYVPVNFLFLRSKTRLIPLITVLSGLVNVGLNLWLVPRYGIMAAAWATFLAYGLTLALAWRAAQGIYPFPYEYKRLGLIGLTTISSIGLSIALQLNSMALETVLKAALLLAYPFVLAGLGLFTSYEKTAALAALRQITRLITLGRKGK